MVSTALETDWASEGFPGAGTEREPEGLPGAGTGQEPAGFVGGTEPAPPGLKRQEDPAIGRVEPGAEQPNARAGAEEYGQKRTGLVCLRRRRGLGSFSGSAREGAGLGLTRFLRA